MFMNLRHRPYTPGEKTGSMGRFSLEKKPIGCSQLHGIGLPVFHREKWKNAGKLSHVESGILSFLGNVSAYGLFSKADVLVSGRVK